jgi:hypothetical protein
LLYWQGGAQPSASASDDVPRVVEAQTSVQQALAELDLEIVNVALVTELVLWFQVCIRQHTSAYVSIRQHTSAYVSIRMLAALNLEIVNVALVTELVLWFQVC